MILTGEADEPVAHGGDLGAARRLFPDAPEPFIDLSTGINPNPYPLPRFSADLYARLPEPAAVAALAATAARAYGAPSADHVVAAPGTQILLPLIAGLVPASRAAILAPGYPEHARAAALAGHTFTAVPAIEAVGDATVVILGNPNNPDGRIFTRDALAGLGSELRRRRGLLVVDEAFMDAAPAGLSFAGDLAPGNVVVLRSFGKFFGLAGLRLGFALAAPALAARIGPHSAPGRYPVRRWPSAPKLWPIPPGSRGRANIWRHAAKRLDATLTAAKSRHCRWHQLVPAGANAGGADAVSPLWVAPASGFVPFRTMRNGCVSVYRRMSGSGGGWIGRWRPSATSQQRHKALRHRRGGNRIDRLR